MNKVYYAFKPAHQFKIESFIKETINTIAGVSILLFMAGLMGLGIGLIETYIK